MSMLHLVALFLPRSVFALFYRPNVFNVVQILYIYTLFSGVYKILVRGLHLDKRPFPYPPSLSLAFPPLPFSSHFLALPLLCLRSRPLKSS